MPEIKKIVIKLDIHNDDDKRKALKAVSGLSGIESLAIDTKDQKLTIVGDVDPVCVVKCLKKWHTNILTVGPAKEPEKKPETDKKPDDKKKDEDEEEKKKIKEQQEKLEAFRRYMEATCGGYYNPYPQQRLFLHPVEDDPRGCVIC